MKFETVYLYFYLITECDVYDKYVFKYMFSTYHFNI